MTDDEIAADEQWAAGLDWSVPESSAEMSERRVPRYEVQIPNYGVPIYDPQFTGYFMWTGKDWWR